jgi:hypothetical protein
MYQILIQILYHAFLVGEWDIVIVVVAAAMIRFIFVCIIFETFLSTVTDDLFVGVLVSIGKVDRLGMFSPCCVVAAAACSTVVGLVVAVAVSFENGFDPGRR